MAHGVGLAFGALVLALLLAACKEGALVAGVEGTATPSATATATPTPTPRETVTPPAAYPPSPTPPAEAEILDPDLEVRAIKATVLAFFRDYNRGDIISAVARLYPPLHAICGGGSEHTRAYQQLREVEGLLYVVTEIEVTLQEGGRDAVALFLLDSFPFGAREPAQRDLVISAALRRESVLWQFRSDPLPQVIGFCLNLTEGADQSAAGGG